MISFVLGHVLESTAFCGLLFVIGRWFTKGPAARHAIGLIGVAKFAVPSLLLAPTGARLAFFWPAAPWFSSLLNRVSAVLAEIGAVMPESVDSRISRIVIAAWAAGCLALVACWGRRLRRSGRALVPAAASDDLALAQALHRMRVRLPVRIASSVGRDGPALHGILRPVIVVPQALTREITLEELHAVLLHELAHARRFDNLAAAFVHAIACVFWFNPLIWILEWWLRAQRERACDELVLQAGIRPRAYAAGILKVCRFQILGAAPGVSALSGSDLKARLESILDGQAQPANSCTPRLVVAALGLLITLMPVAGGYCSQCVSNGQPTHQGAPARR